MFVLYHNDSNSLLTEPMKNRTGTKNFRSYAKLSNYLIDVGIRPKFQILNNGASQAFQREICTRHFNLQMVTPHMHRQNAAERSIKTFKNHFVYGLCSAHAEFPMHLWCKLLLQATLTMNLIRTSRLNSRQSVEEQLNGAFNFNIVQLAPPGKKIIVHEKHIQRPTWAPHGANG